ncbi:MAG: KEOPS complex N(6)-L-threonylcarbamoyladenine synthase Kae1 [Candidatus Micrarchaeia archaeon]
MLVLGIESTAHTLGIGVCRNGKILSNAQNIYKPKNEGIVPRKAADHHAEVFPEVLSSSLSSAGISMGELDLVAFSQGPGIGAPLAVGCTAAKYLSFKYSKPLVGVNHPYAHVKIAEHLTGIKNPLVLYVSGGNTQILAEEESGFRIFGETLDIGLGNLFDTFAREAGMAYAHGSALEKLARGGRYVKLPYTVKGTNLSFTGLQTAAARALREHPARDVAYSLMETAFSMCCETLERALFLTRRRGIIVCGGVAQNRRLRSMLHILAKEDGVKFGVAPDEYNRDNGAMIAYAGGLIYKKKGTKPPESWNPAPNQRIDCV